MIKAITGRLGAILVLLVALGLTALAFVTSPGQPAAQATDGLPAGKQSTRVTELEDRFPSGRTQTALVIFERAGGPLTDDDQKAVGRARDAAAAVALGGRVAPPVPSDDKQAVLVAVPLSDGGTADLADEVDRLRTAVTGDAVQRPDGLTVLVTGGPAFARDIAAAFEGADFTLLAATAIVVAVLLLVTYRSPILWLVPLAVIGTADQVVAKLLPWVAKVAGQPTEGQVSGIVSVLVFGAGTDYALLLIARYREELRHTEHRREAMAAALRGAAPAIIGSATTVVLALLTLLFAVLTTNRTLGAAAALGVVVALLFGLVVLPAALVSLPRGVFWPFVPRAGSEDPAHAGFWSRVAGGVERRPRIVLLAAVVLLAGLAAGLAGTKLGLSQTEQFRTKVESVTGAQALARHYPGQAAQPVTVVVDAPAADRAVAAARQAEGVAKVGEPEKSDDGALVTFDVNITAESGTATADRTVKDLRARLGALDGANALVGGDPAGDLDGRDANLRDDSVVVPLVLAVVLLVLVLLLRSLVAPLLLLFTVVASFAASLGAASLVLRYVLDIPAIGTAVPLLAFLFLVALGVDYNIFLATRAREEAVRHGTRAGMVRALATTGGVITSAGILLAAVFAVLGVLPVIVLTQIGVIVGIGVVVDTLIVRTIVVPALALLLGDRFWWPARIHGRPEPEGRHEAPDDGEAPGRHEAPAPGRHLEGVRTEP
ncbi:MMPL family transporter [Dactylosporangium vinaceum]|uniref:MMPL family transporter n=1 Tax=Dactylosporangium vinaceum TaxID=53362 RepID=A0ABV5MRD6_9ACTN|nr:MMPL family transporter [Dactylosporangium vinaceum]UAC00479.1 MMPL family transporter [Dactylosporangium vinaceum]